jgi:prolipoprotein diacylglyceryltransferase
MNKVIRFTGIIIIGLANLIAFLSTMLKFMLFAGFFVGVFMGVMMGVFDLIMPDHNFYGHIAWDIVAVVIGAGLLYLTWDKTRTQDREHNKKTQWIEKP